MHALYMCHIIVASSMLDKLPQRSVPGTYSMCSQLIQWQLVHTSYTSDWQSSSSSSQDCSASMLVTSQRLVDLHVVCAIRLLHEGSSMGVLGKRLWGSPLS